ncbi:unnamed protein product, partial [Mesorhabditis belari]|uniref:Uncharacterized protein n=1 Tax=Mesorhabditis belari TaxID=2138241 RepID=A0AAF3FPE5_9BILA
MGSAMAKEPHFYDYSSPRNRRKRNSDPSSNHFSKEYAQYWQSEGGKGRVATNGCNGGAGAGNNGDKGRNWTIDKSQYPFYDQSNRYLTQRNSNPSQSSQYGASFSPKEKFSNNFSVTPSSCGQMQKQK